MGQMSSKSSKLQLNRGIIRIISYYMPRPIIFHLELISKFPSIEALIEAIEKRYIDIRMIIQRLDELNDY